MIFSIEMLAAMWQGEAEMMSSEVYGVGRDDMKFFLLLYFHTREMMAKWVMLGGSARDTVHLIVLQPDLKIMTCVGCFLSPQCWPRHPLLCISDIDLNTHH